MILLTPLLQDLILVLFVDVWMAPFDPVTQQLLTAGVALVVEVTRGDGIEGSLGGVLEGVPRGYNSSKMGRNGRDAIASISTRRRFDRSKFGRINLKANFIGYFKTLTTVTNLDKII